jgi:hypothetical protein
MNSGLRFRIQEGDIMRNSEILMILALIFISSSAHATLATCPACSGEQPDWTRSATSFLEGEPVQDTTSTLNGAQQARLLDAQIDARKKASIDSNTTNNIAATPERNSTPVLDIHLNDLYAVPNPANFNDAVKIVAVFGNTSPNLALDNTSRATDLTNLTVYADIENSAGKNVGRVNLNQSSENEYSGIWNVSAGSDAYNTTIEASGPGGSKAFNDALQIIVKAKGSENTTGNINVTRS